MLDAGSGVAECGGSLVGWPSTETPARPDLRSGRQVYGVLVRWIEWCGALSGGDSPSLFVGVGPVVGPVGFAPVGPAGEGLHSVVAPAQAGEVVGVGLPGWAVGVEGVDVVEVGAVGGDRWEERRVGKECGSKCRS